MEIDVLNEIAVQVRRCFSEMDALEVKFIEACYLSEPATSLRGFAERQGLTAKDFNELRARAISRLREQLAARNIRSSADIL